MLISLVNHTRQVPDQALLAAIRAVNRQLAEDFRPHWHISSSLRLEGLSTTKLDPNRRVPDVPGEAVLYLWDGEDPDEALIYHELTHHGVPCGIVFTGLAEQMGEPWSAALSREALELAADAQGNRLVQGPHPGAPSCVVFHWFSMCDAVQDETYAIDGIEVANFVLPLYFTGEPESGARNDFLGEAHAGETLRSFGINPGGCVGLYNPRSGEHETVCRDADRRAALRIEVNDRFKRARRALKYQRAVLGRPLQRSAPVQGGVRVLKPAAPSPATLQYLHLQ